MLHNHKPKTIPPRIKQMLESSDPETRRQGQLELMLFLDAISSDR